MSPTTLGVLLKLASTLVFAFMTILVKLATDAVPTGEILFARSFFGTLPIVVYLLWRGQFIASLHTKHPFGHLRRALSGTLSMFCWFSALATLPLPDATAIGYASPLFGVIFAALILHETVRIYRWSAVTIGFLGVVVVLSEHLGPASLGEGLRPLGALFALLSAVFSALAMASIRKLTATERTGTIVFYFSASASVMALATLPFGWVIPTWDVALMLIGAGLIGGIGQLLLTESYRHAEASVIAPFDYANMLWIIIASYIIFNDVPSWMVLFGSLIIILSGIFVLWRERRLGLLAARAKARQASTPS